MDRRLPAQWENQSLVQFTFPQPESDWATDWEGARDCFVQIVEAALQFQPVLLVAYSKEAVQSFFSASNHFPLYIVEQPSNDSWARDHGPITIIENNKAVLLDFGFNGWGLKFPADEDNLLTGRLHEMGIFSETPRRLIGLILEGGSIDSDGQGTILTTTKCLLSKNRNPHLSKLELEQKLADIFGVKRILWLHHGQLIGDDTDAHIDTLARFCNTNTIAYVQCDNPQDAHFSALRRMEEELQMLKTLQGDDYQLIPLPLPDPVFAKDGHRLPATYANFLILNGGVLVPIYGQAKDAFALNTLRKIFPDRKVVGVNCQALIQQHGSLHCVSMQYPAEVKNIWSS